MIQLWRRVTDSSLIDECTDDIVIDHPIGLNTSGIRFERARSRKCCLDYVKNEKQQLSAKETHHCSYQMISHFLFILIIDRKYEEAREEISNSYSDLLFSSLI